MSLKVILLPNMEVPRNPFFASASTRVGGRVRCLGKKQAIHRLDSGLLGHDRGLLVRRVERCQRCPSLACGERRPIKCVIYRRDGDDGSDTDQKPLSNGGYPPNTHVSGGDLNMWLCVRGNSLGFHFQKEGQSTLSCQVAGRRRSLWLMQSAYASLGNIWGIGKVRDPSHGWFSFGSP